MRSGVAGEFDEADENKLIYTDIFLRFTELVGECFEAWCAEARGCPEWTFCRVLPDRISPRGWSALFPLPAYLKHVWNNAVLDTSGNKRAGGSIQTCVEP